MVAGNARYIAAAKLGWPEIAAVKLTTAEGWSRRSAARFAIFENRTGELSEWDDAELAGELDALAAEGTGPVAWDESEITKLLKKGGIERPLVLRDAAGRALTTATARPDPDSDAGDDALRGPQHVRQITLFYDETTSGPVIAAIAELKRRYGTETETDTIMEALRRAERAA